ncbi:MAG: hypothetical protein ISS54_06985 [Dehalococcoidia bacterium]|nr:hypothetical protein [Dehalococcoidia bacterium]
MSEDRLETEEENIKKQIGEELLFMAYRQGHINSLDTNALWKWWNDLPLDKKKAIANTILMERKREEWHKKKFSMLGWRAWLAGTIPALFAIRWLIYATGAQKWWAVAILLGGGILMRLLINLYDRMRGNPRRVYESLDGEVVGKLEHELEEDKGAKTSSHFIDIFLILLGVVLVTIAALINLLAMVIIGIILILIGLLFFFLRRRYVKKGEFPEWW